MTVLVFSGKILGRFLLLITPYPATAINIINEGGTNYPFLMPGSEIWSLFASQTDQTWHKPSLIKFPCPPKLGVGWVLTGMHISQNTLIFTLIIIDALLIISILLQQREGGLSTVFGGEGNIYRSKRGIALGLHYFTIVLVVLFVALSVALLFFKK